MAFRVVDLFCGCGGLSSGFSLEGFEVIASVDINAIALQTYKRNFPYTQVFHQDIHAGLIAYSHQDKKLDIHLDKRAFLVA